MPRFAIRQRHAQRLTGVGKISIAQAVGLYACASSYSILYATVTT